MHRGCLVFYWARNHTILCCVSWFADCAEQKLNTLIYQVNEPGAPPPLLVSLHSCTWMASIPPEGGQCSFMARTVTIRSSKRCNSPQQCNALVLEIRVHCATVVHSAHLRPFQQIIEPLCMNIGLCYGTRCGWVRHFARVFGCSREDCARPSSHVGRLYATRGCNSLGRKWGSRKRRPRLLISRQLLVVYDTGRHRKLCATKTSERRP